MKVLEIFKTFSQFVYLTFSSLCPPPTSWLKILLSIIFWNNNLCHKHIPFCNKFDQIISPNCLNFHYLLPRKTKTENKADLQNARSCTYIKYCRCQVKDEFWGRMKKIRKSKWFCSGLNCYGAIWKVLEESAACLDFVFLLLSFYS